jgi:hypothetical protein
MNVLGFFPLFSRCLLTKLLGNCRGKQVHPKIASDPRDIYKSDGKKSLTFYEFLLWCIRLGYGRKQFNSKYYVDDDTKGYLIPEPVAYVPTDWVGRSQKWFEVSNDDFRHFYWMQPPIHDWNGHIVPDSELRDISRRNMKHFCVCCGSPPAAKARNCSFASAVKPSFVRNNTRTNTCLFTSILQLQTSI